MYMVSDGEVSPGIGYRFIHWHRSKAELAYGATNAVCQFAWTQSEESYLGASIVERLEGERGGVGHDLLVV